MRQCALPYRPIIVSAECLSKQAPGSLLEDDWGQTPRRFTLAYNLANFMRTLALPEAMKQWSLTSLREKLVKIGAKVVRHGRYVIFQMAEVAVPRQLFHEILRLIGELLQQPPAAPLRETPDGHALRGNQWEEYVQMPAKMARSALRFVVWDARGDCNCPNCVMPCRERRKPRISKPVRESSGKSRLNTILVAKPAAKRSCVSAGLRTNYTRSRSKGKVARYAIR